MELSEIQTANGMFAIAAFDQRASLAGLLGLDPFSQDGKSQLSQLKELFMEVFSPICSGVLVDPDFGMTSLSKRNTHAGLLLPLEAFSPSTIDPNDLPLLSSQWGVSQIAEKNAGAKLYVNYHPKSERAKEKRELVSMLYAQAQHKNIPFIIEPILHTLPNETAEHFSSSFMEKQLQMIADFTSMCDVLKIQFPLLTQEIFDEILAAERCKQVTKTSTVPWILLSRGTAYEQYIRGLEIAMKNGASGFAVGRAVWKEIGILSTQEEQKQFLETTAKIRMEELVRIVSQA